MNYTYRDILSSELLARKQSNPSFSLRAFARYLDMSPSHLSSLILGRKSLTRAQAKKLLNKLELSPGDKSLFLSSAFPELLESETTKERGARLLRDDEFKLLSDWQHFAILSLGEIAGNRATPEWIAKRIGITELQARDALNRLLRLELIAVNKDGRFKQSGKHLTTTDDIPSGAIKSYHKSTLDLAKAKLDSVPVSDREFGAITLPINPAKLSKAKQMIREFQDHLCEELAPGQKKSVYTLAIQFFPLTEPQDKQQ